MVFELRLRFEPQPIRPQPTFHQVKFAGRAAHSSTPALGRNAIRLALEALGFEFHGWRARWDDDALRGNDLQLAGFRVLQFTSAFTDRQIAQQVAEALGRSCENAPGPDLTFSEWYASR